MSLRQRIHERLLLVARVEQARVHQQVCNEVARLGGVPGTPCDVMDGRIIPRRAGRPRT